ncbi:hypothetical protein L3N51_02277 [Metallosphaera sp. J1]|uniref:hypothetical protein n=1 Tax=Metallosphaera TaxID=41980 RepID=UPI001EDDF93D|nr:hypothetical protein [Metallosphaera javensis (ex Hofmann et al. 2022)]MCG3109980.1 hypothetical protein [Metallosphaera javensis (ex Hofmann et al. 2022)]BCS93741.1 MAG: hypothetical protein MjAS7_2349 [Metallosphaera javensis (ex Sakai et al. 2022)]
MKDLMQSVRSGSLTSSESFTQILFRSGELENCSKAESFSPLHAKADNMRRYVEGSGRRF